MRLELGKPVRCADKAVGELADIVIDSGSNSVTHLVVEPAGNPDEARLVPIGVADHAVGGKKVSLRCTSEMLESFDRVREHAYLQAGEEAEKEDGWDIGVEDVQPFPYYGAGGYGEYAAYPVQDATVTYDRVPKGGIELRHASSIYSADRHHLGSVDGVVIDGNERISHLLLARGHFWWRREIPIPARAIDELSTDMVTLRATKDEVGAFRAERRA